MLDLALRFLTAELNAYLQARTDSTFGTAELGRLVDDTGKWAVKEDHLGVALLNVEEERSIKSPDREAVLTNGRQTLREPPVRLNLFVMVAANFKQYDIALRYLSHVVTFFQAHPIFLAERYPGLDPRISRLGADLYSLGFEQLNQIWAFIGGKQLPSVVYRFRLVPLQDVEPSTVGPPILEIDMSLAGR